MKKYLDKIICQNSAETDKYATLYKFYVQLKTIETLLIERMSNENSWILMKCPSNMFDFFLKVLDQFYQKI